MTRWVLSFLLQGLVLPLALLSGAVLRQNGQSLLYLLLLFVNPTVPIPTVKTMFGWTGLYQKFVLSITIINMLSTFAFQIVLLSNPPYGDLVKPPCSNIERYLRYAGLVRLDSLDFWTILRTLSPEVIVLATTLAVHAACKSLNPWLFEEHLLPITEPQQEQDQASKTRTLSRIVTIGKYICLMTLCFAGIIRPSVLNGVYFISFLMIMTLWGYNNQLGKGFAYFCRILLLFVAGHVTALFLYQMQWMQELLPSDSPIPRYLGLISLITKNCDDPRVANIVNRDWDFFVNPFILILLYYLLYFEANLIINTPAENLKETGMTRQLSTRLSQKGKLLRNQTNRWRSATRKVRDPLARLEEVSSPMALTEATPLIRGRESIIRKHNTKRKGVVDNFGNVTITEVPEPSEDRSPEEENAGLCEVVLNVCLSAIQLVAKSSYLAANISMMAWSITYHSWLTFVLLLWASILWLVPNQRKAMLRSSPFLVLYALCLLTAQYIYGMNLTDAELPQTISGLNLKQIGFEKVINFPIQPLTIKILFTLLFWITLKQHNQEKWEARNQSTLADIAAPFQIGLGPAAMPPTGASKTSAFVEKFGTTCRGILTKFWIWVVACILFAIGIAGERITIIRIVYMSMALLFILTFQFNWSMWRNMMYSFWLVLIVYSMIILVVTYTYQFDNFDKYWEEYLKVPLQLQKDIGLERFDTKELFVKLVTPTLFVIITVLQVHYFHDEFLAISDIKSRGTSVARKPSAAPGPFDILPSSDDETNKKSNFTDTLLKNYNKVVNFIWLFLELHLMKLVMFSIMILASNDVCAVHLALVVLAVIGILLNSSMQIKIAHVCSSIVSALIILKMVYQINYIRHEQWDVYCPDDNSTRNSAEWLGFTKTSSDQSLAYLLKGYIGVLIIITVHAVVLRRQKFQRHMQGRQLFRPFVMFPRTTHSDVDKDLPNCIKYLMNYGFYRFGVEISLIAMVALIGVRMDFYASLYGLILCFLIPPSRKRLSKLWPFLIFFIVITIPIQYSLAVGVPPVLCIIFPWDTSETLERLRDWMFLPDNDHPPQAYKLICDFLVLMFVSRQALVFNIEKRHRNNDFVGGSNKPVLQAFDEKDFINPVPDFFSITRSFLDVIKRVLFAASFWICLAVVFLAGTNRVNIFSLGYLIGAFIFLWQGNDLYLRPIKTILLWWNSLLAYNVGVIFMKALLQIIGCIFISTMRTQACWMIQLFGIACIQKFDAQTPTSPTLESSECIVPRTEVGLAWDGCCFAMLILQRRLFSSHYFMRMIDEAKAMAILASRGAELIEDLSNKQVEFQRESEKQLLEKIKSKMDRIKASQKKLHGPNYQEPESHSKEDTAPLARDSTPSISSPTSPQGFHTPVEEETPRIPGFLQAPSPTSAILSRSLDCYLEPQRMSFGSPPASELHRAPSLDDSFPVFSPPPYGMVVGEGGFRPKRGSSFIGPPWLRTPRQSVISNASPKSHHTFDGDSRINNLQHFRRKSAIRSGDYFMFDDYDEELDHLSEISLESFTTTLSDDNIDRRRTSVSQLISTAMKTDVKTAINEAAATNLKLKDGTDTPMTDEFLDPSDFEMTSEDGKPGPSGLQKKKRGKKWRGSKTTSSTSSTPFHSPFGSIRTIRSIRKMHEGDESEMQLVSDKTDATSAGDDSSEGGHGDDGKGSIKPASEEGKPKKLNCLKFLRYVETILSSVMVTITRFLNRTSRDYRYIMKTLSIEKKILLTSHNFGTGMRSGPGNIWRPGPYLQGTGEEKKSDVQPTDLDEITPVVDHDRMEKWLCSSLIDYIDIPSSNDDPHEEMELIRAFSQHNITVAQFEEEGELKAKDQSPFIRMILAMWFAVLSHSELSCYIVIFLHQVYTPTILSLPLPLMVFCWGTLTVPRPSKTFWVTIIAYTEIVVIIKCIFQFEFLYWNKKAIADNAPFEPSRIIGIEKKPGTYAYFDLLVLLVVFFHRTMLMQLGLWRAVDSTRNFDSDIKIDEKNNEVEILDETKKDKELESNIERRESSLSSRSSSTSTSSEEKPIRRKKNVKSLKIKVKETETADTVSLISDPDEKKKKIRGPFSKFFDLLLTSKGRVTADVYAYMFFCDFINFFIVIFGFSSFGSSQGDGGVSQYFAENKVPVAFLVMLILQFGLIIIDRTLYLRKFILGKIIYQYILIVGVHIWMFFILPAVTQTSFNSTTPPMLWYMCKCLYLLLSAYQIRCGYPTRIFGNCLCKSYNYINFIFFKIFMTVPFVFELRTLMDWIWTDTSMTLSDWLKMEDIFAHVFQIKCQRRVESAYPQPRGQKKANSSKYIVGGCSLIGIIVVIWFPLVLFALGNTVGKPNLPSEVSMTLRVGAYTPIYQITAQNDSIFSLSENQWESFSENYWKSRSAQTFLSNYIYDDVGVVVFNPHSTVVWAISPPDNATMLSDLESNKTINVRLEWTITRSIEQLEQPRILVGTKESGLLSNDPARTALAKYLRKEKDATSAALPPVFPKFVKVSNRGSATEVEPLVKFDDEVPTFDTASPFRTINVQMNEENNSVWWQVEENFTDPLAPFLKKLPFFLPDRLVMYTFNDKAFPATLTIVSGKGIIGLYTTFVIVVHSIIRGFFTGISFKIMFDDMPNVDRILQTCLDIYLVRESGELDLEEDLFAKLVFLYRSPETLIKWTRPPEEAGDDDGEIPPAELNE